MIKFLLNIYNLFQAIIHFICHGEHSIVSKNNGFQSFYLVCPLN
jgi:hypothetical protein